MDTIFAQATAPGRAGVAIIRISGPAAWEAAERMCGPLPAPRRAVLRKVADPEGRKIDEGLLILFEKGRSFTGERVAELHLHGSSAAIRRSLEVLGGMAELRPARAGEFTRRALENGVLDLAQVEGLADLIEAETQAQLDQAQRVYSRALSDLVADLRAKLVRASALLEAEIEFSEEDLPPDVAREAVGLIDAVRDRIAHEVRGHAAAERIREGFRVVIVGRPNVGKSTLLNRIAGRDVAIVSDIPGTTRDLLEVHVDLKGLPVTFVDTAGLRDDPERIEALGIARARDIANAADLRVFLGDPTGLGIEAREGDISVAPKVDLTGEREGVSGLTGQGVDRLLERIGAVLKERTARPGLLIRARHARAMREADAALERAARLLQDGESGLDLAAEEIRLAVVALEGIIGAVGVESLLDEIFASFCIGK